MATEIGGSGMGTFAGELADLSAKVVEVHLDDGLAPIEVEPRYQEVLLIVRVGGAVVGHALVPARPRLSAADLRQAVADHLSAQVVGQRLRRAVLDGARPSGPAETAAPATVIVCTRRRAQQLDECLRSLRALQPPAERIVVVDNSPGDPATGEVAAAHGVECLVEPFPGQSRARNRGLSVVDTPFAAFTDDDCVPDSRWLADLEREFADPLVAAVTGYVGPLELEHPAQYLFESHGGFTRHAEPRVLQAAPWSPLLAAAIGGAGANLIVRRRGLGAIGGFAEQLGPGTPARSADDKEFLYRVLALGRRVVYAPDRVIRHRHRATREDLARILNDYGTAELAYTSRALVADGDLNALRLWRWWAGHYVDDLIRWRRRERGAIDPALVWEEVRGALAGPMAMVRSARSRRGVAPIDPGDGATAASARAAVTAEAVPLTVAVASYDGIATLPAVLDGLAAQELPAERFEVVVVLDGSRDGSRELLEARSTPYRLRHAWQPNAGLAGARNHGAREAEHPVVVFLDDDTVPTPGLLAAHAAAHADGGDRVVLGYCAPLIAAEDDPWAQVLRMWWEDHYRRKAQPRHRWTFTDVTDGNMSIPVRLLDAVGRFDESFRHRRQDWELGVRLLAHGAALTYVPEARARHDLECSFERAVANARVEGRDDVALGTKHPHVRGQLQLAELAAPQLRRGPIKSRVMAAVAARAPALASGLAGAGLRTEWSRLSSARVGAAYRVGVHDALPDQHARRRFLAPVARGDGLVHVPWDLAGGDAPALPCDGRPALLDVTLDGAPLCTVRAIRPGCQWDWTQTAQDVSRAAVASPELVQRLIAPAFGAS